MRILILCVLLSFFYQCKKAKVNITDTRYIKTNKCFRVIDALTLQPVSNATIVLIFENYYGREVEKAVLTSDNNGTACADLKLSEASRVSKRIEKKGYRTLYEYTELSFLGSESKIQSLLEVELHVKNTPPSSPYDELIIYNDENQILLSAYGDKLDTLLTVEVPTATKRFNYTVYNGTNTQSYYKEVTLQANKLNKVLIEF